MLMKFAVAAGMVLMMPGAASASDKEKCAPGMICASDPTTVGAALMKAGYQGLVTKADDGDPSIESAAAGYKFWVDFYGCDQHVSCDAIQFFASFKGDETRNAELANSWNRKHRFSQMSVRPDHTLDLRYDVTTAGGLNAKNFADVIDWWATILGMTDKFFNENPQADAKKPG